MNEPRDPKLDDLIKNSKVEEPVQIFQIMIQYNPANNSCRLQYSVGPNESMFWGAIWAAMGEAYVMFERMRMIEVDRDQQAQKKSHLVIAPTGSVPRT